MNAKCALIKEFLDGKTVTVMTCFKTIGLTNIAREVPRMIEQPFNVIISRRPMEGKSRHGSHITWYEYRLNPLIEGNKEGIKKMREYLAENMGEFRPKEKISNGETKNPLIQSELFKN
jgi:hypothetical protein